jgi:fructose-bisphosphate aldolase class II
MALVTVAELLKRAEQEEYAVGAFNVNNMEIVQAIAEAAEKERAPVIMQASQGAIKYAGLNYIIELAKTAAESCSVPIALHLDHGTSFEQVIQCIRGGFSSVMYDGSKLPLEQNIEMTLKVLEIARACGVSVEAELGKIVGTEDDVFVNERDSMFTDPHEAETFVVKAKVDALAVAIGTAHGHYKGEPKLDFERLARIRSLTGVPIVLHGGSGVPDDAVKKAITLGVRKVNIDTSIREAFVNRLKEEISRNPKEIDQRKLLGPAKDAAVEIIRDRIRVFGCSGKA